jgi:hypothetical protein
MRISAQGVLLSLLFTGQPVFGTCRGLVSPAMLAIAVAVAAARAATVAGPRRLLAAARPAVLGRSSRGTYVFIEGVSPFGRRFSAGVCTPLRRGCGRGDEFVMCERGRPFSPLRRRPPSA